MVVCATVDIDGHMVVDVHLTDAQKMKEHFPDSFWAPDAQQLAPACDPWSLV
jgi:hypothetical protein